MNIRKPTDYSNLFAELDKFMTVQSSQMELYYKIGRPVSGRAEKGVAVTVSEHQQTTYPVTEGFSPHNLRRVRALYTVYEEFPENHAAGDGPRLDTGRGDFRTAQRQ